MTKKRFIIILVILVVLVGTIGGVVMYLDQRTPPPAAQSMLGVPAGADNVGIFIV